MQLLLLQHGEAVAKELDPERPLSQRGHQDISRIAGFLAASRAAVPQRILHSDKLRARQSAHDFAAAYPGCPEPEPYRGLAPLDSAVELVNQITNWSGDILIVGHVPLLPKLAGMLVSGREETEIVRLQPGTLLCLERDESKIWAIVWMIRPPLLSGFNL